MEMPTEMSTPTYFIYREIPPNGDPFDATAPPVFFPPKDSDELFDALRIKYPHVKTHSERMRDAVIEFLLEERQTESLSANTSPVMPSLYDSTAAASPWQHSWPSVSSTTLSSPETMAMGTPSFEESPRSQHPQLARHASTATTSTASPPVLENMTSVFSLSTSEQPKQRIRRKMTESEKIEYRKRRIVKACEKCSKRKRKCNHNQPDMDNATSGKTAHKVAKPRTNVTTTKTAKPQRAHEASASFASFDFQPSDFSPMEGFEDFTLMLDEPMPELGFDDLLEMDQQQWQANANAAWPIDHSPWDNTQYWAPVHPTGSGDKGFDDDLTIQAQTPQSVDIGALGYMDGLSHPLDTPFSDTPLGLNVSHTTINPLLQTIPPMNARANGNYLDQEPQEAPATGMLWEHLRTGQVEPTHTAHVHSAVAQGANSLFGPGYAPGGSLRSQPLLAQTVTRLVGTAKAVRTFCSILGRDSQGVAMARIARLVGLASLRSRASVASVSAANGRVSQSAPIRGQRLLDGNVATRASGPLGGALQTSSSFQLKEDMITHSIGPDGNRIRIDSAIASPSELASTSALVAARASTISSGPCEGRSAASSGIPSGLQSLPVQDTALRALGFTKYHSSGETAYTTTPILSRGEVASTSALTSRDSLFDADPTPRGWPSSALDTSVDSTRPSTEMYRLKRRLPRALHSIVSKNRVEEGLADSTSAAVHNPVADRDEGLNLRLLQQENAEAVRTPSGNGSGSFTIGKRVAKALSSSTAYATAAANGDCTTIDTPRSSTITTLSAFAPMLVQADLKSPRTIFSESDTRRYRDHHGRPAAAVFAAEMAAPALGVQLAALVAALAFVSIVLAAGSAVVDRSFLLLALLCPVSGVKGGHGSERLWGNWHRAGARTRHWAPNELGGIAKCSEDNSAWLVRLPFKAVDLLSSMMGENREAGRPAGNVAAR